MSETNGLKELYESDRQLYHGYVDESRLSRKEISRASLESLTVAVERRRRKGVSQRMRDVSLTNGEIARAIRRYAWMLGVPKEPADLSADQRLLAAILRYEGRVLDEQRKQTQYLKSIDRVVLFGGLLLLLAILFAVCNWLGIAGAFLH